MCLFRRKITNLGREGCAGCVCRPDLTGLREAQVAGPCYHGVCPRDQHVTEWAEERKSILTKVAQFCLCGTTVGRQYYTIYTVFTVYTVNNVK